MSSHIPGTATVDAPHSVATDPAGDGALWRPASIRTPLRRSIKWILDRIIAAIAIVLLLPVMAVLAIWVMIDDGRPVLFVQRRTGRRGTTFPLLKFRSMVNNAVELSAGITDDPFGVVKDDPRITRSGRFMRRTSLDELPQLFNVLCGQMSLVGPRPDIPEQVAGYSVADRRRLAVLPGITGWSQINGRDEIEWPERIAQDVEYITNWSLWLDLKIGVGTFAQILRDEPDPVHDAVNADRNREAISHAESVATDAD